MKFAKLTLTAVLLLSFCAHLGADEQPKWESHGPYGGLIFRIQVDKSNPNRILAFTTRGHFLSVDAGERWKLVHMPKGDPFWSPMVFIDGKLYCDYQNSIYVSDDGTSWKKEASLGSQTLFFAKEPKENGRKWSVCLEGQITTAAPGTEGISGKAIFYAAKKTNGKWEKTKIAEREWFPQDRRSQYLDLYVISPADPSVFRVFIHFLEPEDKTHILASDDGGKTWQCWTTGADPLAVAFSLTEPKTIYGAVFKQPGRMSGLVRSKDGGKTWESLSSDKRISSLRTLMIHPKTGDLFLGTMDKGLFKTKDYGKTLIELNKGLYNENISALAADPTDENILYAGTQCGLFKSTDGGKSWKWASEGIAGCQTTGLVTFKQDADRICVFEVHQGIRISKDGGKTWTPSDKSAKLPGKPWDAWCKGKTILLQTAFRKTLIATSKDMGKTWTVGKGLRERDYAVAIVSDSKMFAVHEKLYLYKSTDGASWKLFAGPFNEVGNAIWWVDGPRGGDYILVVGNKGIVKCDAASGKRLGSLKVPEGLLPPAYARAFDPANPDVFYVADTKGALFKCNVGSQEWTKIYTRQKKDETLYLKAILFDPGKKDRIIVGFGDGHIAITEDSGKTWESLKPELPFFAISRMAVTANRKLVVAGNGTVYTLDLSKIK